MKNCTGLCVQRSSKGDIQSVRVLYTGGIEMDITQERYETRQYQPPIDELPSVEEYYANQSKSDG